MDLNSILFPINYLTINNRALHNNEGHIDSDDEEDEENGEDEE